MRACPYPIAELLPHEPPMVLLDTVTGWMPGGLEAAVDIHPASPFHEPGRGVPAHVGIEYMAQACGAYAGLEAKEAGQPVRIGFLLGTRRYHCSVSWFKTGERLTVSISEVLRQGPMGVFDCRIGVAGNEVATARLNVYQPDDVSPGGSMPGGSAAP
jgi:predicted hotdog family 3-hydroxylacyl-ACP dehydratase